MKPDLQPLLLAASQKYGLDPSIAQRVMHIESRGNQSAVSPAGAIGAMQLMPGTARELGVDPYNAEQNIDGGVRYLAQMVNEFGPEYGPLAYNAGPGRMRQVLAGKAPMPGETQNYQKLMRGDDMPPVLPRAMAAGSPEYLYQGQPEGNFKAQNAAEISPEAVAELQQMQELKRMMLPAALGAMASGSRSSQAAGAQMFREAMEGVEPFKLQNGVLTGGGHYVTDQDPAARIRAEAALYKAQNASGTQDANGNYTSLKGQTLNHGYDPATGDKIVTNNGIPYRVSMGPTGPVYVPYEGNIMTTNDFEDASKVAAKDLKSANEMGVYENQARQNPGAFSTAATVASWLPKTLGIQSAAMESVMNEDEMKTRAAVFNQAQNEITRLAGAAQSKEEAARIERFMPSDWDSAERIATKLASAREVSSKKYEANAPGIQKAAKAQTLAPQISPVPTTQPTTSGVQSSGGDTMTAPNGAKYSVVTDPNGTQRVVWH